MSVDFLEEAVETPVETKSRRIDPTTGKSNLTESIKAQIESKNLQNSLWVEKYRPINPKDYIGNELLKKSLLKYIESQDIPHILLHSKESGTGKTTLAKMLVANIKCDHLYINASDENSIENVRTKIKGFASTLGFNSLKIVILDEGDFISVEGQAALRNLMETYSAKTRFIITCNYVDKILNAIRSRSQIFEVIPPSKKDIAIHLSNILKTEKVTFTKENMAFLVNGFYPDIRKILNTAQQNAFDGVLSIDEKKLIEGDSKLKLVSILKDSGNKKTKFNSIRQLIADTESSSFTDWYKYLYTNIDEFADGHIANVISIIAEAEFRDQFIVDKEINFADTMVKLLNELGD